MRNIQDEPQTIVQILDGRVPPVRKFSSKWIQKTQAMCFLKRPVSVWEEVVTPGPVLVKRASLGLGTTRVARCRSGQSQLA
jgi:hypothetical protein